MITSQEFSLGQFDLSSWRRGKGVPLADSPHSVQYRAIVCHSAHRKRKQYLVLRVFLLTDTIFFALNNYYTSEQAGFLHCDLNFTTI